MVRNEWEEKEVCKIPVIYDTLYYSRVPHGFIATKDGKNYYFSKEVAYEDNVCGIAYAKLYEDSRPHLIGGKNFVIEAAPDKLYYLDEGTKVEIETAVNKTDTYYGRRTSRVGRFETIILGPFEDYLYIYYQKFAFMENNLWGVWDQKNNRQLIPAKYSSIFIVEFARWGESPYDGGDNNVLYLVKEDGKWITLDAAGNKAPNDFQLNPAWLNLKPRDLTERQQWFGAWKLKIPSLLDLIRKLTSRSLLF